MPTQEQCPSRSATLHHNPAGQELCCQPAAQGTVSCFFLKHSGFAVLAVPSPGQEGSGPAAGAPNRRRDQRAKNHVVHLTKDIHKPVKTCSVKDQQLFSSAALPMSSPKEYPPGGTPRLLCNEEDSCPGALAVYGRFPLPAAKLAALPLVLIKSQGLGWVEVNRDLACMARQLHSIPRMVTSLSQSFQHAGEIWPLITAGWSVCLKWLLQGPSCRA